MPTSAIPAHRWIHEGRPLGAIAISPTAMEAERFAAAELARYLRLMSGVEVPIVEGVRQRQTPSIILLDASRPVNARLLGDCPIDRLEHDGYLLHSRGPDLFIASKDPFGVVFGTYQFLSRVLGVRFYDFGPAGEDVPCRRTVEHPRLSLVKNPRLWYRGTQMAFDPRRIDWMAKNGFNYSRIGSMHHPLDWWDDVLARMKPELQKRGIRINFGHHSFQMMLPLERYAGDAPDLFVAKDSKPQRQPQFYWSLRSDAALDEVIYNLEQFLGRHPEIDMLDFWPSDGISDVSEEDYRAVTGDAALQRGDWEEDVAGKTYFSRLGDRNKEKVYAVLTARVAEALRPRFPKLKISLCAYADLTQPCPDVLLPDNVTAFIAIYWRCRRHSLVDQSCEINRQYRQIIEEWTTLYPGRVCLSEYYSAMGAYASLPYPCLTHLFDEWRAVEAMGVVGAKVHTGRDADAQAVAYNINFLAFADYVWGDAPEAADFLRRYCQGYFGEAWEQVHEVYTRLESAVQEAEHTQPALISMGVPSLDHVLTPEVLAKCRELLDQAMQASTEPKSLHRISRVIMLIEYTRAAVRMAGPLWQRHARTLEKRDTEDLDRELLPQLRAMVQRVQRLKELDLDVYGYQRPSPFFVGVGVIPARADYWARLLGTLEKQAWVQEEMNSDILEERAAVAKA